MEVKENILLNKNVSVNSFCQVLHIYLKKPEVVNRKLSCIKNILFIKTNVSNINYKVIFEKCFKESVKNIQDHLTSEGLIYEEANVDDLLHLSEHNRNSYFVSLDKIIPRNSKHKFCYQLTTIDITDDLAIASFDAFENSTKIIPAIDYKIRFDRNHLLLFVNSQDLTHESCNWLQFVFMKKLQNWIESSDDESEEQERIVSHSLIDSEEYSNIYQQLKEKYGSRIESIWTDEVTDPKKFIYEDIAIATYLICLWNNQKSVEPKSFVDLGCGNGLLVYILSQEGYRGYGIDLRKRKIWDKYIPKVDLREETWNPSIKITDVNWILGNHSDELSPWVPVVAAYSSPNCNYFLLPCCSYEFSGMKFQRKGTAKSLYMSFVDYLQEISNVCGFEQTQIDRLKIPSTKRICLIGMNQIESNDQHEKIQSFIDASNERSKSFIPREKTQAVKNCTKIDKNLCEKIVKTIFNELLSEEIFTDECGNWNCGRELPLADAVKLISSDDLKNLKSQFGGLQTMLRNKHQVFEVFGGHVRIRKPKRLGERKFNEKTLNRNVIKSVPCYFYLHHKQGCYLSDEECCYKHEK